MRLRAREGDRSTGVSRVPRAAALAVGLGALGLCAAGIASSAPSGGSTPRASAPTTPTTSAATTTTTATTDRPDGPGGAWALVFSDHFAGTNLDTSKWSTCYYWGCTNGGNNELEFYQASQVAVHDGTASLTVVPDQADGKGYVSGLLSSYGKFSFRYGYAQIVAKLPRGRGLWSAFWTEPESGAWPPEIDVMEDWAQLRTVSFYVHFGSANLSDSANVYLPTASSAFHTYGVDWEPGSVSWYVDGFLVAQEAVSITQPEYLIADLAVWGRTPPNSTDQFPQSLVIRSIDVWQHP